MPGVFFLERDFSGMCAHARLSARVDTPVGGLRLLIIAATQGMGP